MLKLGTIFKLLGTIYDLTKRVQELERALAERNGQKPKNSQNSSKPPSSDGYNKPRTPKSQRTKTGKTAGGQAGHTGANIQFSDNPDETCTSVFRPGTFRM